MTSNMTNITDSDVRHELVRMAIYITEGALLVLFNLLLGLTILKHEALRSEKEFLFVAALAIADAICGFGTLTSGIYRVPILLDNTASLPSSAHQCILNVHVLCWLLAWAPSAVLMLAISMDRFLLVAMPLEYLSFTDIYAKRVIGVVCAYAVGQFAVMFYRAWNSHAMLGRRICLITMSLLPSDMKFLNITVLISSFGSIAVCVAVGIIYRKRIGKVQDSNDNNTKIKLDRQRKFTKTVGVTCLVTFLFHGIPTVMIYTSNAFDSLDYSLIGVWGWIINGINPLLNLFIYVNKQTEIRMAFFALLQFKQMPPNLQTWNAHH